MAFPDEASSEKEFERVFRHIPRGLVPVAYRSGEMIAWLPEERLKRLIIDAIYPQLLDIIDALVRKRVDQRISYLERKLATQRNLVGLGLCAMILAISVTLSTLSFLAFNVPEIGVTFLYGAVAALGGMVFIWYREIKERM